MWLDTGMTTTTTNSETLPPSGTAHTHEFLISGCRYQWVHDHDQADCWRAFMAHNERSEDTTFPEYYA